MPAESEVKVPGLVAVALMSGRTEMLDTFIKSIRDGAPIEREHVIGLATLLKARLEMENEETKKLNEALPPLLADLHNFASGLGKLREKFGMLVSH